MSLQWDDALRRGGSTGPELAQLALEHLADVAARQFVEEAHVGQALGLAEAVVGPGAQLVGLAVAPGSSTTKATGVSPHSVDGTPTTAASATAGCWRSTASRSLG